MDIPTLEPQHAGLMTTGEPKRLKTASASIEDPFSNAI
jgi:hypothetical protein